ncbi:MAG: thiamine phosphate synthase [Verrucomicrobiota bacterium]
MARSALFDCQLYGILDLGYTEAEALVDTAKLMVDGGIDIVQLRAKGCEPDDIERWATSLQPVFSEAGVPFVINDYPEIAARVGTDAVHVGQDDLEMDAVREIVGDEMLVGRSTHSLEQAAKAASDPRTDCIGFGPLFSTPTKPDYVPIGIDDIRAVHEAHPDLPIFCIGGIKKENLHRVVEAGARRAVIVSGILQAPDMISYIREAKSILAG